MQDAPYPFIHLVAMYMAWVHFKAVPQAGEVNGAQDITTEFGIGELHGGGEFRYYGDHYAGSHGYVYPCDFDFHQCGVVHWKTVSDTLEPADMYYRSCTFVKHVANGDEVGPCKGKDVPTRPVGFL